MTPNALTPSASGARIGGDDLQHAVAWHAALRTLVPHAGVIGVEVEALEAGNVDDVVVRRSTEPDEYTQVKAAVSARKPADTAWLCAPSSTGGASILQRFHRSWRDLGAIGRRNQLALVTNRSIDPHDRVLQLRDRNDQLSNPLRAATVPAVVRERAALASHLECGEDELLDMLADLQLRTDASEAVWRTHIKEISYAAGIRTDEIAYQLGLAEIRRWVKTDRLQRRVDDISALIDKLELRVHEPFTVIRINTLEKPRYPSDARIALDWTDRFRGTEARNRRGLNDPRDWERVLRPELLAAQSTLRVLDARRILLVGTMRLPAWFTAAVTFQESAGFTVARYKDGELWTKPAGHVTMGSLELSASIADFQAGEELAIALAISTDHTDDVRRHFGTVGKQMPILTVQPGGGAHSASLHGARHAYGMALAIRELARQIERELRPPVLHLFIAGPPTFAVLLGSMWDRVPTTQTYEDLRVGYEPAFLIPN